MMDMSDTSMNIDINAKNNASPTIKTIEKDVDSLGKTVKKTNMIWDSSIQAMVMPIMPAMPKPAAMTKMPNPFPDEVYSSKKSMSVLDDEEWKNAIAKREMSKSFGDIQGKTKPEPTPGMEQRKFLMPFLSIMFGAMAAQKALQSLVAPAEQLVGIQEIINTMLGMFFLPIMLWLLDPLFWLFEIVTSLDEGLQGVVGAFVLMALVGAAAVVFLTQFGLALIGAIATLSLASGGGAGTGILPAVGTGVAGILGGVGAMAMLVPLLVIAAIIIVIALAWERFCKLVKDEATNIWNFVSGTYDNVVKFLGGVLKFWLGVFETIIGIFIGIVTGKWDVFIEGIGLMFSGIKDIVDSVLDEVALLFTTFVVTVGTILGGVLEVATTAFNTITTWLIDTFMPALKQPWTDFSSWIGTLWEGIKTTVMGFIQPILDAMDDIGGGLSGTSGTSGKSGGTSGTSGKSGGDLIPGLHFWDEGGYVSATAPGMLHAGEYVVPRGGALILEGGGGDKVVNVYADVSNDVDITRLADQIARIWHSDTKRGV